MKRTVKKIIKDTDIHKELEKLTFNIDKLTEKIITRKKENKYLFKVGATLVAIEKLFKNIG